MKTENDDSHGHGGQMVIIMILRAPSPRNDVNGLQIALCQLITDLIIVNESRSKILHRLYLSIGQFVSKNKSKNPFDCASINAVGAVSLHFRKYQDSLTFVF